MAALRISMHLTQLIHIKMRRSHQHMLCVHRTRISAEFRRQRQGVRGNRTQRGHCVKRIEEITWDKFRVTKRLLMSVAGMPWRRPQQTNGAPICETGVSSARGDTRESERLWETRRSTPMLGRSVCLRLASLPSSHPFIVSLRFSWETAKDERRRRLQLNPKCAAFSSRHGRRIKRLSKMQFVILLSLAGLPRDQPLWLNDYGVRLLRTRSRVRLYIRSLSQPSRYFRTLNAIIRDTPAPTKQLPRGARIPGHSVIRSDVLHLSLLRDGESFISPHT